MANNNHFNLKLDTLAPTGSITRPDTSRPEIKENRALTIVKGDATFMKVWFDSSATSDKTSAGYLSASWESAATSKITEFTTNGDYYYHLVLMDDVNNESEVYHTQKIRYDITAPTISDLHLYAGPTAPQDPSEEREDLTKTLENRFKFSYGDNFGGGVEKARVYCSDFATNPTEYTIESTGTTGEYSGNFTFKSSAVDGLKTIEVEVVDKAGNVSTKISKTITLDKSAADAILIVLKDQEGITPYPEYGNFLEFKAEIDITSSPADVVAYKLWGDIQGKSTEGDWVSVTKGTDPIFIPNLKFTNSTGNKTLHAKVKDDAGNEATLTDVTAHVDLTIPVISNFKVTYPTSAAGISKQSGYDTATLTFDISDVGSGINHWELKCNNKSVDTGSTAVSGKTVNVTATTTGMVEGTNTFTLDATDKATNAATQQTVAVFTDYTAPTASIKESLNTWYNVNTYNAITLTINNSDGAGIGCEKLYAWVDTSSALTTTIPTGYTAKQITSGTQTITAADFNGSPIENPNNYLHIVVIDKLNNRTAIAPAKFGYDETVPAAPTLNFSVSPAVYSSINASIGVSFPTQSATASPIAKIKFSGDIEEAGTWNTTITNSYSVKFTGEDGLKTVQAEIMDAAGNISPLSVSIIAELDRSTPTGSLTLRKPGTTEQKEARSKISTFDAFITFSDDDYGAGYYKLYGDFTTSSDEWKEITAKAVSGTKSFTISNLVCTSGDGTKNVTLMLKDNAEHIIGPFTSSFYYDTTVPDVKISDLDYNVISEVHSFRRDSTGPKTDYADEIKFTFFIDDGTGTASGEHYQAYKVCAYKDATTAAKGSAADPAIGTTHGSINMSASGLNQATPISAVINGKDFHAALGTGNQDGVHIVVAYIQDTGGNWSVAASFEV